MLGSVKARSPPESVSFVCRARSRCTLEFYVKLTPLPARFTGALEWVDSSDEVPRERLAQPSRENGAVGAVGQRSRASSKIRGGGTDHEGRWNGAPRGLRRRSR